MFRDETNRVTLQTYKRRAYRALMIQLLNWSVTGIIGATNIEASTNFQDGSRLFGLVANQVRTVGCCRKHVVHGRSEETWPLCYTTSTTGLSSDSRKRGKNSIQRCQRHRNVRSILLASEFMAREIRESWICAGAWRSACWYELSGYQRQWSKSPIFHAKIEETRPRKPRLWASKGEKLCLVLECLIYTWVSFCLCESF